MIGWLKNWANQIIVAIIIATIFEMILPNGNNKKYIKMVIGIYVLFTIIQPIITKVTGNNLELIDFNYERYFKSDVVETISKDFDDNNSKLIKQAYIDNIKDDIKVKIRQKGYEVISCTIDITENENLSAYGRIENINLGIKKIEEEITNEKTNNTIKIKNVDINLNENQIDNTNDIEESLKLSEKEKTKIIEYLVSEYSISKENIIIN